MNIAFYVLLINTIIALPISKAAATDSQASMALAYVTSDNQMASGQDSKRFHPNMLLDNDPKTAWCALEDNNSPPPTAHFKFKHEVNIDTVLIRPSSFSQRNVDTVKITGDNLSLTLRLDPSSPTIRLPKIIMGKDIYVTITQTSSVDENNPTPNANNSQKLTSAQSLMKHLPAACLSDVIFSYNNQPLNNFVGHDAEDPLQKQIIGSWYSAPLGAPKYLLTFAIDETWQVLELPSFGKDNDHDKKEKVIAEGRYDLEKHRLFMKQSKNGPWLHAHLHLEMVTVDPLDLDSPRSNYNVIELQQPQLGEWSRKEFNNAKFDN